MVVENLSSTFTKTKTECREPLNLTPSSTKGNKTLNSTPLSTKEKETKFCDPKDNCGIATQDPLVSQEVEIADTLMEEADSELIPSSELTPIFIKSCSRRNFATRIIRHLVDYDTRKRSNVHGRGKEQLDPQVVKYAKIKCFEYFPCPASSIKEEWSMCIIAIDDSCRWLNKQKT